MESANFTDIDAKLLWNHILSTLSCIKEESINMKISKYMKSGFSGIINIFKDPIKDSKISNLPVYKFKPHNIKESGLENMTKDRIQELLSKPKISVIISDIL